MVVLLQYTNGLRVYWYYNTLLASYLVYMYFNSPSIVGRFKVAARLVVVSVQHVNAFGKRGSIYLFASEFWPGVIPFSQLVPTAMGHEDCLGDSFALARQLKRIWLGHRQSQNAEG